MLTILLKKPIIKKDSVIKLVKLTTNYVYFQR